MFKQVFMMAACALCIGAFANEAMAQAAPGGTVNPELRRSKDVGETDKPARAPRIVLPADPSAPAAPPPGGGPGTPPVEDDPNAPPVEPPVPDPPVEEEDPPTFFGEPVSGNFVWCLDRSGSMGIADSGSGPIEDWNGNVVSNPNRITVVKSECIKVLGLLKEEDEFAITSFGDNPEWTWFNARVPATDGNKQSAINFVRNMQAYGWTPAYTALMKACTMYGTDLDKLYFLCDGSPNYDSGAPGGYGGPSTILSAFPGWFSGLKAQGCELVCVCIGSDYGAAQFMQDLANQNGGTYIKK